MDTPKMELLELNNPGGNTVDVDFPGAELGVVNANPQEVIAAAEQDMNFLAALCLTGVMKFMFPPMLVEMWELLKLRINLFRVFPKIALGIPRGFSKTTFVKLFVVFCVLFTKKRFIIIISYNEEHAITIITDVFNMLSGANIVAIFGDWTINRSVNQAATKVFSFRGREIIIKGIGAKGGVRGINFLHYRPDLMIFEDYQRKEESKNEEISKALYEEMIGTAMKACSPFGCMFLYIGNMYATTGAILKKLKNNSDWESLIVGAVLKDGTSLWEELQPIKQLIAEYQSDLRAGVPHVFLAEKLNDENAGIASGIDISLIPKFPYEVDEQPQARGIIIDPALDNPNSDYNGVGLVGLFDGKPTLEHVELDKFSPLGLIKTALKMGFQYNTRLITVENAGYQASLLFWFDQVIQLNHLQEAGFVFMPLDIGQKSKNNKISDALQAYMKGELLVKDLPKIFLTNEIISWRPMKKNNKDTTLDLLWMSVKIVEQYEPLMLMPYEMELRVGPNATVRSIEENCSF